MTPREALQDALAAEHAALWVHGLLGAQTSRTTDPALAGLLDEAYAAHRERRDRLTELLVADGAEPVAALAAYDVPGDLGTAAGIERAALDLERGCAAVWATVVESTVGERRRLAVAVLTETAVRELDFRGTPEMFPGSSSTRTAEGPGQEP
ncbi:ferritin-like domain-containing protein [Nocardioides sp. AX2bis]|uniref:ferritin-like domain-containing protein n=1 Tax=Nocardioides sp. AX2bis TaxID=2653157 RepID=UPI0012EF325C|nr:ferritin-like domain-containing protein [Nocardioides sp. AX2bis]VXB75431.1 conserved hypothetical protein [Nocardioides sp. AX2bis]